VIASGKTRMLPEIPRRIARALSERATDRSDLIISIWWALAAFMAGGCGGLLLIGLMLTSAENVERLALIRDTLPRELPPQ
jgi:hypothetical protein